MLEKEVILNNEGGLHARAAALFVQAANRFISSIYVELDGVRIDGKSIVGVMSLGAFQGERIKLIARGEDEREALEELTELLQHGLEDVQI
ncbi:MAG: HPr family phosphocarrier protein [Tissierellia bacterium]|nr:HPr family phosphocarrier protein [Tissierellia bacterium]